MKICLYSEFYKIFGGTENIGTGFLSALRNQRELLARSGISFVETWDDSCDLLQVNTPWPKSLWLANKVRKSGKKVIMWAHVTLEDSLEVFWFVRLIAPLYRAYLAYGYGRADLVLCPTHYTKRLLVAYGIPEEKIAVQSNGVDTKKFYADTERGGDFRREHGLEPGSFVVGTLGLVIPRKGVDTFLALAKRFPDTRFVWCGKIFGAGMVASLPEAMPPNVLFTGYVHDILAALNAFDVFMFPSREENQGMAILEAAAVGLPIVVRDIPAYEGWLEHEGNCLKARSEDEFAVCIERLRTDEALRTRLRQGATFLARQETIEVLAPKLLAHYVGLGSRK
jgi:1,2-diacylglycerol-3-alpha-glucose alpha-1,2-glucosyltransferase